MICRIPTQGDARSIATAHVLAWQTAYAGIMPAGYLASLEVADSEERWNQWLRSSAEQVRVVEASPEGAASAERRVVGFAFFGESRDDDASAGLGEIRAINLHPGYWRRGIGSELLRVSLEVLTRDGFAEACLWVLTANAAARSFYEALGWRADGARKHEAPEGCPPLEHVRYRIALEA